MTLADFNVQFDLYYNNIGSNQAPGLNPYEKSVFLTDAQNEYAIKLYNGKNPLGESFEQTEELRRYLSTLILDKPISPYVPEEGEQLFHIESNSQFFKLPQNAQEDKHQKVWFIVYESVKIASEDTCMNNAILEVYPTKYDEYQKLRKNPFRGANDRRVLRFDYSDDLIELVSNYTIAEYDIRYLRKPKPIILEDLEDGLTIDEESNASECELPDSLHKAILMRAVELAIQSWNKQ